jgi:hypothetical protein
VQHAGPRGAVGALDQVTELFRYGRSREAWALLRAAAEARPDGAVDEVQPNSPFVCKAIEVAVCTAEEGQPWVMLAVQPLVARWLRQARDAFYASLVPGSDSEGEWDDGE